MGGLARLGVQQWASHFNRQWVAVAACPLDRVGPCFEHLECGRAGKAVAAHPCESSECLGCRIERACWQRIGRRVRWAPTRWVVGGRVLRRGAWRGKAVVHRTGRECVRALQGRACAELCRRLIQGPCWRARCCRIGLRAIARRWGELQHGRLKIARDRGRFWPERRAPVARPVD